MDCVSPFIFQLPASNDRRNAVILGDPLYRRALSGCSWLSPAGIFQERNFTQAAQMPFGPAVFCGQVSLDKIPSHFRPHSPSTHAENVHMIVLDSLFGREVIVDQRGADSFHLVSADRCTDPAAADGYAPLHFAGDYRVSERDDEVRIVVTWIEAAGTEVRDLMAISTQPRKQLFLQPESAVISGDPHLHVMSLLFSAPAAA